MSLSDRLEALEKFEGVTIAPELVELAELVSSRISGETHIFPTNAGQIVVEMGDAKRWVSLRIKSIDEDWILSYVVGDEGTVERGQWELIQTIERLFGAS